MKFELGYWLAYEVKNACKQILNGKEQGEAHGRAALKLLAEFMEATCCHEAWKNAFEMISSNLVDEVCQKHPELTSLISVIMDPSGVGVPSFLTMPLFLYRSVKENWPMHSWEMVAIPIPAGVMYKMLEETKMKPEEKEVLLPVLKILRPYFADEHGQWRTRTEVLIKQFSDQKPAAK
jgi:hypothetical protein